MSKTVTLEEHWTFENGKAICSSRLDGEEIFRQEFDKAPWIYIKRVAELTEAEAEKLRAEHA